MSDFVENKIREWGDKDARETNRRLEYLERKLFSTYNCSLPPRPNFWTRVANWIKNANGDKQLEIDLFNSINSIFYISSEEFNELYRRAYNGPIARWLIDKSGVDFTDIDTAQQTLNSELGHTLFCGVSDSFNINHFYHINNVPGSADIRPEWRTLQQLGNESDITDHLSSQQIKYLVLLEDFVGGGSQARDTLIFTSKFLNLVSILFVPLVICPAGMRFIESLSGVHGFDFEAVLPLSKNAFVQQIPPLEEPSEMANLRELANNTYSSVSNGQQPGELDVNGNPKKPYHPLGWNQTGGLIVMHTNTPDNTLPMFHYTSDSWEPIFPRHSRV